jgi:translation initiation factor 4G
MDFTELQKNLQPLEAADRTADQLSEYLSILTPSNIDMIVYDARQLKIDTAESLSQCVDVIFEAALSSEWPSMVAILCTKVLFPSVPVCHDSHRMITFREQIYKKSRDELENFVEMQSLIRSGQFDTESENEKLVDETAKSSCFKKLQRPMALIRFIGELYLVEYLQSSFIEHCISRLLDETNCNESTLETLCALLKIVGKKLESSSVKFDFTKYFKLLKERKSSICIHPHTRFMIEEIFNMRNNLWEPVNDIDWITFYNLFLCDVEEKLYILELWYGNNK